jgi:hypothetical protein
MRKIYSAAFACARQFWPLVASLPIGLGPFSQTLEGISLCGVALPAGR